MFDPAAGRMINTVYATLFTYSVTVIGSALVFLLQKPNEKVLDLCLGLAAGVMLAVTVHLIPTHGVQIEDESGKYQKFNFLPVAIGLLMGAGFVFSVDMLMGTNEGQAESCVEKQSNDVRYNLVQECPKTTAEITTIKNCECCRPSLLKKSFGPKKFSQVVILVIAITVHNIPEGLALGVAFGAIGKTDTATFEKARNLALGVAFHNFPEGLAVSLPLRGLGLPSRKAFLLGQVTGLVEPIFGIIGCLIVSAVDPVLPYALAFAAGTMLWVVIDGILPETRCHGNGKLATIATILGFTAMISLDIASHGDDHGHWILNRFFYSGSESHFQNRKEQQWYLRAWS